MCKPKVRMTREEAEADLPKIKLKFKDAQVHEISFDGISWYVAWGKRTDAAIAAVAKEYGFKLILNCLTKKEEEQFLALQEKILALQEKMSEEQRNRLIRSS